MECAGRELPGPLILPRTKTFPVYYTGFPYLYPVSET